MLGVVLDESAHVTLSVTAAVAVLVALWRVAVKVVRLRDQFLALMRKVEIMWQFQSRRGDAEASAAGVTFPPGANDWVPAYIRERFAGLAPDLHAFYRSAGHRLADSDLRLELEARFGERIVRDVCRPLGWGQGACLRVAAIICREADQ